MMAEEKCVQLKRSDSYGFGFSILGGSGSDLPPIIYEITENSPAAASGELEAGDVILEVNDKQVFTLTTKEVLKRLRLSSDLVTLKLKRDPKIKEKVKSFLSASTTNEMDMLNKTIQSDEMDNNVDDVKRRSPLWHQSSTESMRTNGVHSTTTKEQENASSNGGFPIESSDNHCAKASDPIRTPPRFETFMMTGDLILNLNANVSGGEGGSATTAVPKHKRAECVRYGHSSTPASPEDGDGRGGRAKGIKRESPSLCSPVADKKAAYGYTGNFVRTSRSEDHLQKDYMTMVNIDIDDDITSSLHTLLDTRQENPANERIVWTYNAPVSHDSLSSSPHSSPPSSPLQSPSYRPLRSPSPSKGGSPRRKTPLPPYSSSPSPSPSPTSSSAPVQLDYERCGQDSSGEAVSPTSSEERNRGTDLETDESLEGSPKRPLQNGVVGHEQVDGKVAEEDVEEFKPCRTEGKHEDHGKKAPSGTRSKDKRTEVVEERHASSLARSNFLQDSDVSYEDERAVLHACASPPPFPPDDDSDIESLHSFHYSPKAVDMPSASRLAKRLYHLEGFKKSDVSRHLSKNNEFSRVVAEEYLKFFEFTGDMLDLALRKFLKQFCLTGETQERERVLVHFSKRFLDCNPGSFNSQDAVHTLTCALMLLNTDLHGQNIGRKMTCAEFIDNLSELNDGENFPKDVLKALYHSIKSQPLEWAVDDEEPEELSCQPEVKRRVSNEERANLIGHNPFLEVPNATTAIEYKKGYVMRKCCIEPNGKRTPLGKRGWKMFYATLKDLVLYLHKDEHGFKKNQLYDNLHNSIRIHHALATKATDYTKKQHVFRLQTSDWAEYLFQTSDSKELQSWIDTINFVSASLSAPPLAGAVGSQKKFQRPLLPCSHTKLNLREQLQDHEQRVVALEQESEEHRSRPPEKGAKSRVLHEYQEKELYLQYELKRYKTYVYLLRSKMAQHHELESSLVETFIGEVDERDSDGGGGGDYYERGHSAVNQPEGPMTARSMTDRYSYRAAIYSSNKNENCV